MKVRERWVLIGSDYSSQEVKLLAQLCNDLRMIQAFVDGKDLYSEIASISFHRDYFDCIEFFYEDSLKEVHSNRVKFKNIDVVLVNNKMTLCSQLNVGDKIYYNIGYVTVKSILNKTAANTIIELDKEYNIQLPYKVKSHNTNKDGKSFRTQSKQILLGIMYGRGAKSISEQLNCSIEEAENIIQSVYNGFPAIYDYEQKVKQQARDLGYVNTLWGRKRRLPDMQLPEYEFKWSEDYRPEINLLDFSSITSTVPDNLKVKYLNQLNKANWYKQKNEIIENARKYDHVEIIQNSKKIADAERQCVNSTIQGSASDMSKKALCAINSNQELRKLNGLVCAAIHDEILLTCPIKHAKKVAPIFTNLMETAANDRLTIPISCDVEISDRWYGDSIEIEDLPD